MLLLQNVGNFVTGAILFDMDPHAANLTQLISVGIHFSSNLCFIFLKFNKIFDLIGFNFHFLLANQDLGDEFFCCRKVNFGHDFFHFFKTFWDAFDGIVFKFLEVQKENGCFVLLANAIDLNELILPFFEGVFYDLMIFSFICFDSVEFLQVVEVHFDHISKSVTVNFKEWVSGVDRLIQRVNNLLLSVICHNNHF